MATGIYSWSQTAASNASADSAINFAEGQAPSTLNDSCRGVMSILSKWRDDISGVTTSNAILTTGGAANAQTLTTNGSIAALTNGWTVTFKAGFTNTGACTLALDGLAATQIQRISGTNLIGGEIIAGCVYTVTYHQPAGTFVLHSRPPIAATELLAYGTISGAATQEFVLTSYTGYRQIDFVLTGIQPATDAAILYLRTSTDGGANYDIGASDYSWIVNSENVGGSAYGTDTDTADTEIELTTSAGVGNAATESANLVITLANQTSTAFHTQLYWRGSVIDPTGQVVNFSGAGARLTAADVDAIRILFSSGNIDEGKYAIIGYR